MLRPEREKISPNICFSSFFYVFLLETETQIQKYLGFMFTAVLHHQQSSLVCSSQPTVSRYFTDIFFCSLVNLSAAQHWFPTFLPPDSALIPMPSQASWG